MGTDLELFEMDLPDGFNMLAVHGQGSKSAFLRVAIAVGDTLIFSGSGADDVCYFAGSDTASLAKDMIGSLIMSALFAEKIPGTATISATDVAAKFVDNFNDTSGTTDSEWSVVAGGTLNEAKVKHTYKDAGNQPKTEYVEILKVESVATAFVGFAVEVGNYVGTSSSLGTWTQLPTDIDGVICLAANVQGSNASITKFAMISGGFCVMTYTEEGEGSCYF